MGLWDLWNHFWLVFLSISYMELVEGVYSMGISGRTSYFISFNSLNINGMIQTKKSIIQHFIFL